MKSKKPCSFILYTVVVQDQHGQMVETTSLIRIRRFLSILSWFTTSSLSWGRMKGGPWTSAIFSRLTYSSNCSFSTSLWTRRWRWYNHRARSKCTSHSVNKCRVAKLRKWYTPVPYRWRNPRLFIVEHCGTAAVLKGHVIQNVLKCVNQALTFNICPVIKVVLLFTFFLTPMGYTQSNRSGLVTRM